MVTSVLVTWHSIIMCSNLFHVLSYTGFDCFIFNLPPFFYSLFQCLFFLVSSSTWDSQPLGDCRLVPTCAYWLNVLGDAWSSGCLLLREPEEDMDNSGILMNCWENVNSAVIYGLVTACWGQNWKEFMVAPLNTQGEIQGLVLDDGPTKILGRFM